MYDGCSLQFINDWLCAAPPSPPDALPEQIHWMLVDRLVNLPLLLLQRVGSHPSIGVG